VTSLILITKETKINIDLQCDDLSCIDSFLLCKDDDVDFFAFTMHDEELLNSDEESAEIS